MDGGVIFDLDGVLIDSENLQYRAYAQVLAHFGVRVSRDEYVREWITKGGGPEYAVRTYHLPVRENELREMKHPVYHRLLREEARLMPGVAAALNRLAPSYKLAVATNSIRKDTSFVLEHFNLQKFFDAVVTRECYERPKPEPDAFLAAAAALSVVPSACVVVEDTYRGVLAAYRAGVKSIAVPNQLTRDNDFTLAERVLGGLDEIGVDLIDAVLRGVSPTPGGKQS